MSTIGNSPDYQLGYQHGFYDGLREGYNRALEQMRDLTHQMIDRISNHYTIVVDSKIMEELKLYLLRWQLSTPILAVVTGWLAWLGYWTAAAVANLIGATIFFWVDRWIFTRSGING